MDTPFRRRFNKRRTAEALGFSTDTLERKVERREFPPGILDGNRRYWFEDQIRDYNAALEANRPVAPGRPFISEQEAARPPRRNTKAKVRDDSG